MSLVPLGPATVRVRLFCHHVPRVYFDPSSPDPTYTVPGDCEQSLVLKVDEGRVSQRPNRCLNGYLCSRVSGPSKSLLWPLFLYFWSFYPVKRVCTTGLSTRPVVGCVSVCYLTLPLVTSLFRRTSSPGLSESSYVHLRRFSLPYPTSSLSVGFGH